MTSLAPPVDGLELDESVVLVVPRYLNPLFSSSCLVSAAIWAFASTSWASMLVWSSCEFAVGGIVYSETGRGGPLIPVEACGVTNCVDEGSVVPWPRGVSW
jgi:hypothetical protein